MRKYIYIVILLIIVSYGLISYIKNNRENELLLDFEKLNNLITYIENNNINFGYSMKKQGKNIVIPSYVYVKQATGDLIVRKTLDELDNNYINIINGLDGQMKTLGIWRFRFYNEGEYSFFLEDTNNYSLYYTKKGLVKDDSTEYEKIIKYWYKEYYRDAGF